MHVDERVMIVLRMLLEEEEGIRINPKWAQVFKLAGYLKIAPREKKREIMRKLAKINARTPFDLTDKS
jgi:hypothetical protein